MLNIIVCKNYEEMSEAAARSVLESIRETPDGLLSFPGGDTPLGMVRAFVRDVNAGKADISKLHYVSLDEWVGLASDVVGSCGKFNHDNLFAPLKYSFADKFVINGAAADIEAERRALNAFIEKYGPLTVSVLGIGMNGHLGFNESGVDFDLDAHIIPLDEVTKGVMQKYFDVERHPTQGITQGIRQIMAAKKVILLANGAHKADIVARAAKGAVTNEVPASVLQKHPNSYLIVDEAAASKL